MSDRLSNEHITEIAERGVAIWSNYTTKKAADARRDIVLNPTELAASERIDGALVAAREAEE